MNSNFTSTFAMTLPFIVSFNQLREWCGYVLACLHSIDFAFISSVHCQNSEKIKVQKIRDRNKVWWFRLKKGLAEPKQFIIAKF